MTTLLGIDFGALALSEFGGQLFRATLHKETSSEPDVSDPTSVVVSSSDYVCDAIPFAYALEEIDGDRIYKSDYRVTILRTSIQAVLDDGVSASLDMSMASVHVDSIIEAVDEGAGGNEITVELVGDALAQAGTIRVTGTNVRIGFLPDVTTVADVELLVATISIVRVRTAGTASNVLDVSDAFASTPLADGVDASSEQSNAMPTPTDTIECPPPGQSVAKLGRIIAIEVVTDAQITVQVRGETF